MEDEKKEQKGNESATTKTQQDSATPLSKDATNKTMDASEAFVENLVAKEEEGSVVDSDVVSTTGPVLLRSATIFSSSTTPGVMIDDDEIVSVAVDSEASSDEKREGS